MAARRIATASIVLATGAVGFAIACVDLFHSTDFKTLCTENPQAPQCGGSAATDGGSDAGTDAPAKPPIDLCTLTSEDVRARAIKACALLGACGASVDLDAFGRCVPRAMLAMDCAANPHLRPRGDALKLWQCLAEVASCRDIDTCLFGGARQNCSAAPLISCSDPSLNGGNVLIDCALPAGAENTRFDPCLTANQRCTRDKKTPQSSQAFCTGGLGLSCTVSTCEGTNAVVCDGIDKGIDCAGLGGGSCFYDVVAGGPVCTPGGTAVDCPREGGAQTAAADCDESGGVALACVNGKEVAIDCRRLGLKCDKGVAAPSHDLFAKCVTDAAEFEKCLDATDTCSGGFLHGCSKGGEEYVAQCTALGLGTCAVVNGRANCAKP